MGEGFATAAIKITNAGYCYSSQTNELSEFEMENIAKGKYVLSLIGDQKELVIENLEID